MKIAHPEIIALDDWLIYAKDQDGAIVFASSECWPEWLDFDIEPEEMDDTQFKQNSLDILRIKTDVQWRNYAEWFIQGEMSFALSRGLTFNPFECVSDLEEILGQILAQAEHQKQFIKEHVYATDL